MTILSPEIVRATGTAATDTANLQEAIDRSCSAYNAWSWQCGIVILQGHFMTNAPLTVNSRATQQTTRACYIVGINGATIEYQGTTTDDYIIKCYGRSDNRVPILDGLIFNCSYKCRGPLIDECGSYRCSMRDVTVLYSRQVGLELVSNWGSNFENVRLINVYGIGLRATNFISSGWTNLKVSQNGVEDAHWPAIDDTTVLDYNDNPIQTPVLNRAAVIVGGGQHILQQTLFEGCYASGYPLMFIGTSESLISGLRMEGNIYTESSVVFQGGYDALDHAQGRTTFTGVNGDYSPWQAKDGKNSFLELRGDTDDIRVVDSQLFNFGSSLIRATEGTHTGICLDRVKSYEDPIPENSRIVAEGAAVIDSIHSITGSMRVQTSGAYYFGSDNTEGSWRIIPSSGDLLIQKHVSSNWVTKSTIT